MIVSNCLVLTVNCFYGKQLKPVTAKMFYIIQDLRPKIVYTLTCIILLFIIK